MSKSLEAIKLVLQTQRTVNTDHKRMVMEFPKVQKERDKAQEAVAKLTERAVTAECEAKQSRQAVKQAEKNTDTMSKSLEAMKLEANYAEQKLRDLENEACVNAKKHKWMSVASALGMDVAQSKRIEYLAKHMHDTKSKDWQDSLIKKSDLTTRLPTAVRLLLQELFSCVRVNKRTVPVINILRHVYQQQLCDTVQTDIALKEIQKAVRSAVRSLTLTLTRPSPPPPPPAAPLPPTPGIGTTHGGCQGIVNLGAFFV